MKIEDIDKAKELKDGIDLLNGILESSRILEVTIEYYDERKCLRQYHTTQNRVIESMKLTIKQEKHMLEEQLNKLL